MQFIKLLISTLLFCLALDLTWLGWIAKNLYYQELGGLMRSSPILFSGFIVYLIMVLGIICFVLPKTAGHFSLALLWGGLFGLMVYGIYDFTNYSILANWPLKITIIDLIWGIVLCGVTTAFAMCMQQWLSNHPIQL